MKNKVKKLLSILTALTLLVGLVLPAGVIPAFAESDALIAYVNQASGNNSEAVIGNSAKPFKTINAAIRALDVESCTGERIVKIQDAVYTLDYTTDYMYSSNVNNCAMATHTNPITIEGANGIANTIRFNSWLYRGFGGPTTFDNISYSFHSLDDASFLQGHELNFGAGAKLADGAANNGRIYYGAKVNNIFGENAGTDYSMVIEGENNALNRIFLANQSYSSTFATDANLVIKGGTIGDRILLGGSNGYVTTYAANVNIQIDSCTFNTASDKYNITAQAGRYAFEEGAAFQVILNNGTLATLNVDSVKDAAQNECLYLIKSEANAAGLTLSATETAGIYQINGDFSAYAPVVYDKNGDEVEGAYIGDGTIAVNQAGTYTVEWETAQVRDDAIAYVNQASGNNSEAVIGNSAKPFKTINAAIRALDVESCTGERIVKIQDAVYTLDYTTDYMYSSNVNNCAMATHTNPITIEGANGIANTIRFNSWLYRGFGGPTTFDNISYSFHSLDDASFLQGHELNFGAGAKLADGAANNGRIYYGAKVNNIFGENAGTDYSMVIEGENNALNRIFLANQSYSSTFATDANLVIKGGTIGDRILLGGSNGYVTTYAANVNIQIDSCTFNTASDKYNITAQAGRYAFEEGAAFQVILNNGTLATLNVDSVKDAAENECLYLIKSEANAAGLTLSATETAGIYQINGILGNYIPVVKKNGNVVEDAFVDGKIDLTGTDAGAGTYTVEWKCPSIVIATMPNKTEYRVGEELNTEGLSLTYTDINDNVEIVTQGFDITGFNSRFSGEKTVTVTYSGFTTTFTVTVCKTLVTEVTFPSPDEGSATAFFATSAPFYYGGTDAATAYTLSFDYYLPKSLSTTLNVLSVSQNMSVGAPAMDKTAGIHHYEWTAYSTLNNRNGLFVPAIEAIAGTEIDVWNWSVKINGEEIAGQAGADWEAHTNGTVGRELNQYYWYFLETGNEMDMTPYADMTLKAITFSATNNQWHEKVYRSAAQSESNPYIVSFDYYLQASPGATVTFSSRAGSYSAVSGSSSATLLAGKNTFVRSCYTSLAQGVFAPMLRSTGDATLYIWNYSVTLNGAKISGTTPELEPTAGVTDAAISGFSWYNDCGRGIVDEAPVTKNTALLYNEKHSSIDAQAEALRQEILGTSDDLAPSATGTTYYVSMSGDNSNNGTSPATAWRTVDAVAANSGKLNAGDVVLFERGGVYRGTTQVTTGVSYGAYGAGSKPCLYASPRNYADASLWEQVSTNIWRVSVPYLTDIGNVVFDHGVVCASDYKICEADNMTPDNLTRNFQYYHINDGTHDSALYMYYDGGNPALQYSDIEFCLKKSVFNMGSHDLEATDVVIDNLCIKYSGNFGIVFRKAKDMTITNCEIGYIGGSLMNSTTRYGNGIEFNSHVDTALVKNNWIYQCYDAGYTNQGSGATHNDILVSNNLIEYCNYNIEIFVTSGGSSAAGVVKNCTYENNILRFAGYGFGTNNRYGSSDIVASNICYWYQPQPSENTVIRGNVLDVAYRYLLVSAYVNDAQNRGPIVTQNTWVQNNARNTAVALQVDVEVDGWSSFMDHTLPSTNLATMKTSVAAVDTNPIAVIHESDSAPITGIAVTTMPTKTTYELGDALDTTGLVLELTYSDGTTALLTGCYTVTGFDSTSAGDKALAVRFANVMTTITVTVNAGADVSASADCA